MGEDKEGFFYGNEEAAQGSDEFQFDDSDFMVPNNNQNDGIMMNQQ